MNDFLSIAKRYSYILHNILNTYICDWLYQISCESFCRVDLIFLMPFVGKYVIDYKEFILKNNHKCKSYCLKEQCKVIVILISLLDISDIRFHKEYSICGLFCIKFSAIT